MGSVWLRCVAMLCGHAVWLTMFCYRTVCLCTVVLFFFMLAGGLVQNCPGMLQACSSIFLLDETLNAAWATFHGLQ